jgi:FMN phosphatase YigB (HAD superfamily)
MAGTLLPFNQFTGKVGTLPGSEEFLPEMGKDFRLVVTTGDDTQSARNLLSGFGLLSNFEKVFGGLYTPLGKPYGRILREINGRAECSLAIGDRMRADLPADTDQVVTVLINQNHEVVNAGMVSFLINILRKHGEDFPDAFRNLARESEPAPELVGDLQGGRVVNAWTCNTGFYFRMLEFQHALLDGVRLVIQI